jgi:hypothetical protein
VDAKLRLLDDVPNLVGGGAGQGDASTMKRSALVAVLAVGLLLVSAAPSFAWWHRGWWGPPYWHYAPPPVVVAPAPVVVTPAPIIEPAPVYAQQTPAEVPAQGYWYFCPSTKAYYPRVQSCSEAWVKVPPRTP